MLSFEFLLRLSAILKLDFLKSPAKSGSARPPRGMKFGNNKIPVSSEFNDSEGLYGTIVCRCLVRRPHFSARLMSFGSRGPSEFATEMP